MIDVAAVVLGLGGVALGSASTYLQQRATVADGRRYERLVRWDRERYVAYVALCTANDRLYRAVDKQDDQGTQQPLGSVERAAALEAFDEVVRIHTEIMILYQSAEIRMAADELLSAVQALYRVAKDVSDESDRAVATSEFLTCNAARREAVSRFLAAAAEELGTRRLNPEEPPPQAQWPRS
jgi:hypothetical protein